MVNKIVLLFIIIFLIAVYVAIKHNVIMNDISYGIDLLLNSPRTQLENNKLNKPIMEHKNRILLVTYDDRKDIPFIVLHNKNLEDYAAKWGYKYSFQNECVHNTYWCKLYVVLEALESNRYDWVVWFDTDTIIKNPNISIDSIVNKYSSDIFVGAHYEIKHVLGGYNSGVFIIKNSPIGKQFIQDAINTYTANKERCLRADGKLNGIYSGSCYEQAVMNSLMYNKYKRYTTTLDDKLVRNSQTCYDDVFIMHNYGSTADERLKCFSGNSERL